MWQVLFLYKYVWVLFLTVCLELIHIELSDVVAVLLNLALSVVHEDYETLLEEVCVALYVLKKEVRHDDVCCHLVEVT